MMNDECGMMNEERRAAFYSSFRIHHSSFLFMVGLLPWNSKRRIRQR
jgi:hypothetical protein